MSRNRSLGFRLTALCAGVAVVLSLIAAGAAVTAAANRAHVTHLVDRVGPASNTAERLMAMALAQQTSVRQYAGSGLAQHLEQYRRAVADEEVLRADTRGRPDREPALLAKVDAIAAELAAWRAEVAEPLVAATRAGGPDPSRATVDPATQDRFTAATASIAEFQREAAAAAERLRVDVRQSGDLLLVLLITAAVVVLLTGIAVAVLLRRMVTQPIAALGAEVRRVVDGDYQHEITAAGPPELQRLAHDVNAMRRQIAADLSEVRSARQQVEDANRQLELQAEELTRSNRDLEQFAYVASHDLQEPLRKVASFCQLLQRRYAGRLDERADQYIYFAVDGAQRMQRLINDLLAFSRIGRITSGFTDVDLGKVVSEVVNQREPSNAEVTWDELPTVRGEEPLLSALFNNLIGNSLKFRRPDAPAVVHLGVREVGEDWELYVRDNGIGIDPEFADKIFVIFQRLHVKDAYPGTGIGLAIAKKIVEYHGGRIWLDTGYRDGTLIRFTLPASVPAAVTASRAEESGS